MLLRSLFMEPLVVSILHGVGITIVICIRVGVVCDSRLVIDVQLEEGEEQNLTLRHVRSIKTCHDSGI